MLISICIVIDPEPIENVEEWICKWNDEALRQRLADYDSFYKESLGQDGSIGGILSSIPDRVIHDFDEFKFDSESGGEKLEAFRVRDFGRDNAVFRSHPCDQFEGGGDTNFLNRLKEPRSEKYSHGREIEVLEFTPSAVTTVLMSSAKGLSSGPNAFHTMLKHLSAEGFFDYRSEDDSKDYQLCFCMVLPFCILEEIGVPSASANPSKCIRLQKFSISLECFKPCIRSGPISKRGAWLLAIYGAPARRRLRYGTNHARLCEWIAICLMSIRDSWVDILEEVDRQISVKGTMRMLPQSENNIIFHDEHPYRWALQTLCIFLEMVASTTGIIERHLKHIPDVTGEYLPDKWYTKVGGEILHEFERLSYGIEQRINKLEVLVDKLPPPTIEAGESRSLMTLINSDIFTTASVLIFPLIMIMLIILDGELLAGKLEFISFFVAFNSIGAVAIIVFQNHLF
ncbi:hypothetical protein DFP73DRAFT_569895 [Morchella snyderi]|nr:hypothetical protein DFP73DRAFT_569895 [Morchella snyderi]